MASDAHDERSKVAAGAAIFGWQCDLSQTGVTNRFPQIGRYRFVVAQVRPCGDVVAGKSSGAIPELVAQRGAGGRVKRLIGGTHAREHSPAAMVAEGLREYWLMVLQTPDAKRRPFDGRRLSDFGCRSKRPKSRSIGDRPSRSAARNRDGRLPRAAHRNEIPVRRDYLSAIGTAGRSPGLTSQWSVSTAHCASKGPACAPFR